MSILVTGAAGFVGLNLLETLLGEGHDVVAFDRQALPARAAARFAQLPGRLHVMEGEAQSAADLDRGFTALPVQAVLHAAVITATEARERSDPAGIAAVNLLGAIAVFEAARRHGVGRFVAPSSVAVYGMAEGAAMLDEASTWPRPTSLYGITKLAAEQALLRLAALHGMSFAAVRLGAVYGPWEWRSGARDLMSPPLQALERAEAGEEAVLNRAPRGDNVYARDVARGLLALLLTPTARGVFNLGHGGSSTVAEWCAVLGRYMPGFRWRIASPGEAANVVTPAAEDRPPMELTRLRAATGWAPRFDFAAGAEDYLAWRRDG